MSFSLPLLLLSMLLGPNEEAVPVVREEIVVTPERRPTSLSEVAGSVSVIDREEMAKLPAENVSELLESVPGIISMFGESFGGAPMVSSRGFFGGGEVEYVQLLVDGVPVGDAESGLADWKLYRTAGLERVEVLRGPATSLYGDAAIGGIVQLISRKPDSHEGEIRLGGGSFETGSLDLFESFSIADWQTRVIGSFETSDGYRDHSSSEAANLVLALQRNVRAADVGMRLSWEEREREDAGALSREEIKNDRSGSNAMFADDRDDTARGRLSLFWNRPSIRANAFAARRDSSATRTLLLAAGFGDRADRDIETSSIGGSLVGEHRGVGNREILLQAGVDVAADEIEADYRKPGQSGSAGFLHAQRDRAALFLSMEWTVSNRISVVAGARYDTIEDDLGARLIEHDAFSPRLAVSSSIGRIFAYALASKAFKAPTLDQLADPRPFPSPDGGSFTISNPGLVPQRATNFETGLASSGRSFEWNASAYSIDVEDEIDFDPATFTYQNIGSTRHRGVEIDARRRGTKIRPMAFYSWTDVRPRSGENQGTQLKNIPRHHAMAGVIAPLGAKIDATITASWTAGRYLDDANYVPLDDALVFNARLSRDVRRARISVDLLNLTGEEWSEAGFLLPDFATGDDVAHELPSHGFAARVGVTVSLPFTTSDE